MEYVTLDGERVPVVSWRDVPGVKRPTLRGVGWDRIPVRRGRPTTEYGRLRSHFFHEPFTPTKCTCGQEFESPADHLRHLRSLMPSWDRVRFRYADDNGEQFTKPMIGHYMRFQRSPKKGWGQISCECGWQSQSRRIRRPGPAAREHVREAVRRRLELEQAQSLPPKGRETERFGVTPAASLSVAPGGDDPALDTLE